MKIQESKDTKAEEPTMASTQTVTKITLGISSNTDSDIKIKDSEFTRSNINALGNRIRVTDRMEILVWSFYVM